MRVEQRLFVRNPDHAIAARLQPSFPFGVTRRDDVPATDAAIDFHDQPRAMTGEVDHKVPE